MLVGFIGCPSSGKTTTAAKVFAELKDRGVVTEFIPEQARWYIAEKRNLYQVPSDLNVFLTDSDQRTIAYNQSMAETNLLLACQDTVVITDASSYCAGLYMSAKGLEDYTDWLKDTANHYDILFYTAPVTRPLTRDVNRVHDEAYSLRLDSEIPAYLESMGLKAVTLTGNSQERTQTALVHILELVT